MRLAIVGCEASGKTVFMAGLADHYRPETAGGLCLVPENAEANHFARFQLRQMRALRQWPPATNPGQAVEMKWTLRRGERRLAEIDMLEFGGETFRAAFRDPDDKAARKEAEKALFDYLAKADSIAVLVSIKELLRDPGDASLEEFERDTESIWVTRGLLEFVRRNMPRAGLVVGLTQADRYRRELEEAGGAERLFASRWPAIAAVAHGIPVVAVASVSATDENGNPAEGYSTEGVLAVVNELKRQKGKPARASSPRRAILLLFLLLAVASGYVSIHPERFFGAANPPPTATKQRAVATVAKHAETNAAVEAEAPIAETNAVEETAAPVKSSTSEVDEALRDILDAPPLPNRGADKVALPDEVRTWSDHRGVKFQARWTAIGEDGRHITLERVPSGKKINAALRKLSAEDRAFVQSVLDGGR